MNWEYSCGAVVFTRQDDQILYVIVQEISGAYSFPKGHTEGNETELETAKREIFEETGLQPVFIKGFREKDEYELAEKPGTRKRVTYFLANFQNESLTPRIGEIQKIHLMTYELALQTLEHDGLRRVLTEANEFLKGSTSRLSFDVKA